MPLVLRGLMQTDESWEERSRTLDGIALALAMTEGGSEGHYRSAMARSITHISENMGGMG